MSELTAAQAMQNRLQAALQAGASAIVGYVPFVQWPHLAAVERDVTKYSLNYLPRVRTTKQRSMSRPQKWETQGTLRIILFGPVMDKTTPAKMRQLAALVRDAYSGKTDEAVNVIYRSVSEAQPMPNDRDFAVMIITVDYVFTDHRS